jgi:hypothetical protein
VPLGEIIPRCCWRRWARRWWWLWWRQTRWLWWWRTDAPLCALGLGAGLLGPTSSPLTLLGVGLLGPNGGGGGGSKTNEPSARRSRRRLSSSDTLAPPGRRSCLQPLCPCPRGGGHGGGAGSPGGGAGSHAGRLGASGRRVRVQDPTVGVSAAGLANRHAALVEGRQRGQNHRPQPCIIAERRDALGEDK